MMDLIKAMQDPDFMKQMQEAPAIMMEKLVNIENMVAEILQICKSANPIDSEIPATVDTTQ